MSRRFRSAEELISALHAAGVGRASMICRVATVTAPGGSRLVFRGRVCISAELAGERLEYEEELEPHAVTLGAAPTPVTGEHAGELQCAQQELMRQIRLYREQYQPAVATARKAAAKKLRRAGIRVVDAEP